MKKTLSLILLVTVATQLSAQTKTIQERLGYKADTKLLIIHADDIGVSHSENEATIAAFEKGIVNSGSIMVPCPWFQEIAAYAVAHPNTDLGLHLTLTSEWNLYKWGTVVPRNEAPTLVDAKGFFPDNVADFVKSAKPNEAEKELRGQIERAKQFGIDVTHLDTHMGTLMATPDLFKLYIKLGQEYQVPVLLHRGMVQAMTNVNLNELLTEKDVITDNIIIASPNDYKGGMKNFYTKALKSLPPGLTCLLIHVAYDNAEMQAVTINHPDYGAAWRQADFDFFTSEECRKILKDEKIQLVTWREIRDKITRK